MHARIPADTRRLAWKNPDGSTSYATFEDQMVELAEAIATELEQEQVVVELQRGGQTRAVIGVAGVAPRKGNHMLHEGTIGVGECLCMACETPAALPDIYDWFRDRMRLIFESESRLLMVALFVTKAPHDDTKLLVFVTPKRQATAEDKARFAADLHTFAQHLQPVACILGMEAWEASNEEAETWLRTHGTLQGMPGVREALHCFIETKDAQVHWFAPLDRAGGKPTVRPWQRGALLPTGRFTGLVRRPAEA
jgi:hypothetical protein